jgi:DNA topoisomerase IB
MRSVERKVTFKVSEGTIPSHVTRVSESQALGVPPSKKALNAAARAGVVYAALALALCYAL